MASTDPVIVLLLLAFWLFAHPWVGIWHDTHLYAVQAMRHLLPAEFEHDLYFMFGSQDAFTIFSSLYVPLVAALGLEPATGLLLLCAHLAWAIAATVLVRYFVRGFHLCLALVLLVTMPGSYGPYEVFGFSESFLTPRPFAEALTLAAIACVLHRKLAAALLFLLAAFAFHPLMALAGAAFVGIYVGFERPRAVLGATLLGALGMLLLGYWRVAPFDRLFITMDPAWFEQVAITASLVTWEGWDLVKTLNHAAVALGVVFTAALSARGTERRFFLSVALGGVAGLLVSWIGTGLTHNVLMLQIQPWRTLWLVQWSAYLAAAWLVRTYWREGRTFQLLLAALLIATLTRDSIGGILAALAGAALVWQTRSHRPIALSRTAAILAYGLLITLTLLFWIPALNTQAMQMVAMARRPDTQHLLLSTWLWNFTRGGGGALCALALFLFAAKYHAKGSKLPHLIAFGMAISALGTALITLNRSSAFWSGADDATRKAIQETFLPHIPANKVVYWEEDVKASWFILHRSNYASSTQLVGLVFNRYTALEGQRRMLQLRSFGMRDSVAVMNETQRTLALQQLPRPSFAGLVRLCQDPVLDFVVQTYDYRQGFLAQVVDQQHKTTYYLHDCRTLRPAIPTAQPAPT
ncbi:MAG: hypothetical protein V4463_16810 [Pseudomonadota bacterium]